MRITDTNYELTIDNIEQVKIALGTLEKTVYSHIPQEITKNMIK